ncbi:hypothetical protein [Anabaena sp. CCY 9910]|uniref:hypothetical protein n=1 Tax=Anabaena sp. CCY 9910 TaxID=3103870 RepID=UPI0039DFEC39
MDRPKECASIISQSYAKKRHLGLTGNVSRQLEQIEFFWTGFGKFNVSSFGTKLLALRSSPADVMEVLHQRQFEFTVRSAVSGAGREQRAE